MPDAPPAPTADLIAQSRPLPAPHGLVSRLWHGLLHLYFRLARGLTLGVRAVVLDAENRVVLVRHSYTPGWHLPGGGVEAGESAPEALAREVQQETGLALSGPAQLLGVFHNSALSPRDHVLVYLCRSDQPLPARPSSYEILEFGYFSLDALPEGVTEETRARLRDAQVFAAKTAQ